MSEQWPGLRIILIIAVIESVVGIILIAIARAVIDQEALRDAVVAVLLVGLVMGGIVYGILLLRREPITEADRTLEMRETARSDAPSPQNSNADDMEDELRVLLTIHAEPALESAQQVLKTVLQTIPYAGNPDHWIMATHLKLIMEWHVMQEAADSLNGLRVMLYEFEMNRDRLLPQLARSVRKYLSLVAWLHRLGPLGSASFASLLQWRKMHEGFMQRLKELSALKRYDALGHELRKLEWVVTEIDRPYTNQRL